MARKVQLFKTRGMNRDLSVSAFNPEFSFENMNLRLSTKEGNTMMSWVNERGTADVMLYKEGKVTTITGLVIGTAVINHALILFVSGEKDKANGYKDTILKLTYREDKTSMDVTVLYTGKLSLSSKHPIETLVSYESEQIQKVYWTDGINQPRVINIHDTYSEQTDSYNPFDFVPELALEETVKVRKILGGNGMFSPGVIQYALTYYNKYMQESCIFYTTPLYYISHKDRGASPEDMVNNAFQITVENVDNHFEYLRIYSIQRTSINDTPIVRRVQDIPLSGVTEVFYTDTGTSGNTVDPMELLYKGGDEMRAETLEQKDNTLFLGNIKSSTSYLESSESQNLREQIKKDTEILPNSIRRSVYMPFSKNNDSNYVYANQLTGYSDEEMTESTPCAGFKVGDKYRFGVQFQYKNGKWSNPIWVRDVYYSGKYMFETASGKEERDYPRPEVSLSENKYKVMLPCFKGSLPKDLANKLIDKGYRKVRPLVVFPRVQDRVTICQGVACPTLYTSSHRSTNKDISAQSSWFFRTGADAASMDSQGAVQPVGTGFLEYSSNAGSYNPSNIRQVEIQGIYDDGNKFQVDTSLLTLHSPDLQFDDNLAASEFMGTGYRQVGALTVQSTLSDIDIQTESPTISNDGSGFVHKSFMASGMHGIVSGLFYDDYIVDDNEGFLEKYNLEHSSAKWMVYLWNKEGSLNNDINRPSDKGVSTAKLMRKAISNLRFCGSYGSQYKEYAGSTLIPSSQNPIPQVFSSDDPTIVKIDGQIYMGNIDTMLVPDASDGQYFSFKDSKSLGDYDANPSFTSNITWKTFANPEDTNEQKGLWRWNGTSWGRNDGNIGDKYEDLVIKKSPVRMKYKSTAHLVFKEHTKYKISWEAGKLPIVEITRSIDDNTVFGGTSKDALMENNWIPCGEPQLLTNVTSGDGKVFFECIYGDTYFQRWDCMKTYPFTREDTNQMVEIGSFMLETHINIDGRYDRNRGQLSNINMSPVNFNLINPVYSQVNNFFTYKILDEDSLADNIHPNQITWSLTKTSGSDVDAWTSMTLASILELDGDKGSIQELTRLNDQLIAFQDTGISQILYNENVQISSNEGVPIEIANSGKVQGKRYLSDTVGCSNRHSLTVTPSGIYFMDSNSKDIWLFNGQLQSLSSTYGLSSWAKQSIPSGKAWDPVSFEDFVAYYDRQNQDILFINADTALAFSERFGAFTSFYDYGRTPYFISLDDSGLWVKVDGISNQSTLYLHNQGDYGWFFTESKPYWTTLIGNPEPQTDKVFTNLELRASVIKDGTPGNDRLFDFNLPFDALETWNDYQHGTTGLQSMAAHSLMPYKATEKFLSRKFRIWDCEIPRDDSHKMDRMRNPWLYLKLKKEAEESMNRMELHDVMLTYFI